MAKHYTRYYSEALGKIDPNWKIALHLPTKNYATCVNRLRQEIRTMCDQIGRPLPADIETMPEGALYDNWFERNAEVLLQIGYPVEWQKARKREDDFNKLAAERPFRGKKTNGK